MAKLYENFDDADATAYIYTIACHTDMAPLSSLEKRPFKETETHSICLLSPINTVFCIFFIVPSTHTLEIAELVVDDEYQSAGLGTRVLRLVEEYAKSLGCTHSQLDIISRDPVHARLFYEKNGYAMNVIDHMIKTL